MTFSSFNRAKISKRYFGAVTSLCMYIMHPNLLNFIFKTATKSFKVILYGFENPEFFPDSITMVVSISWKFGIFHFSWCLKIGAVTAFESSYWIDIVGEYFLGHDLQIPVFKMKKIGFVFNRANFEFEKVLSLHLFAKKTTFSSFNRAKISRIYFGAVTSLQV